MSFFSKIFGRHKAKAQVENPHVFEPAIKNAINAVLKDSAAMDAGIKSLMEAVEKQIKDNHIVEGFSLVAEYVAKKTSEEANKLLTNLVKELYIHAGTLADKLVDSLFAGFDKRAPIVLEKFFSELNSTGNSLLTNLVKELYTHTGILADKLVDSLFANFDKRAPIVLEKFFSELSSTGNSLIKVLLADGTEAANNIIKTFLEGAAELGEDVLQNLANTIIEEGGNKIKVIFNDLIESGGHKVELVLSNLLEKIALKTNDGMLLMRTTFNELLEKTIDKGGDKTTVILSRLLAQFSQQGKEVATEVVTHTLAQLLNTTVGVTNEVLQQQLKPLIIECMEILNSYGNQTLQQALDKMDVNLKRLVSHTFTELKAESFQQAIDKLIVRTREETQQAIEYFTQGINSNIQTLGIETKKVIHSAADDMLYIGKESLNGLVNVTFGNQTSLSERLAQAIINYLLIRTKISLKLSGKNLILEPVQEKNFKDVLKSVLSTEPVYGLLDNISLRPVAKAILITVVGNTLLNYLIPYLLENPSKATVKIQFSFKNQAVANNDLYLITDELAAAIQTAWKYIERYNGTGVLLPDSNLDFSLNLAHKVSVLNRQLAAKDELIKSLQQQISHIGGQIARLENQNIRYLIESEQLPMLVNKQQPVKAEEVIINNEFCIVNKGKIWVLKPDNASLQIAGEFGHHVHSVQSAELISLLKIQLSDGSKRFAIVTNEGKIRKLGSETLLEMNESTLKSGQNSTSKSLSLYSGTVSSSNATKPKTAGKATEKEVGKDKHLSIPAKSL